MQVILAGELQKVRKYLERMKAPQLVWKLIHHDISALTGTALTYPPILPTRFGRMLTHAFTIQSSIGWTHFLKGRIARAWGEAMAHYYNTYHTHEVSLTRYRFQKGLIRHLWRMYEALWIARSKKLHNPTNITALGSIELDTDIRHLYSRKRFHCGIGDQHLFRRPLRTMLHLPKQRKAAWLAITTERSQIHSRQHSELMRRIPPITTYFKRIYNEEPPD